MDTKISIVFVFVIVITALSQYGLTSALAHTKAYLDGYYQGENDANNNGN
ncbi:MAG: hypothetical protein WA323_14735 [Candidatus Nitrosopolaris sp.]